MLLPKVLQYYKSYRNRPASQIRPLSSKASYSLWLLFAIGLLALTSTLPFFRPENIFIKTDSYPLTPGSIILTRLRKFGDPTAADEKLCQLLDEGGKHAAHLYARYGPESLNNPLARPDEIDSKFWHLLYAAPSILAPHLAHLFALGVATSGFLSGKEGARWRTISILVGLAVAGLEVYLVETYDLAASMRGVQAKNVPYIHWQVSIWRGVAIAVVDAVLGWMLWLQATGRAFVTPDPPIERIADSAKLLEALVHKVGALGIVRNGTMRDADLRRKVDDYWLKEQEAMADILEQPQVSQAQRNVLAKKDMGVVRRDINQFVDGIVNTASTIPAS